MTIEQVIIGSATAILCMAGLRQRRWLLENTRKGRWLVQRVGPAAASWLLCSLLAAGGVFGVLLAMGVVNPVHW
jgi:hypothetical protein